MTRRQFGTFLSALGAMSILDPQLAALALDADRRRLSWLANRTAGAEGAWTLTEIEGAVPKELDGTLYRIAPGQKENHGIVLQHFFDGDAFMSGFSLREGKVTFRAQFVALPERLEELKAGKMLYSEFGTMAPADSTVPQNRRLSKNQPSVNVIHWDGRLLGLSEGGHPTEIDPVDFSYKSRWNFYGTLPPAVPFTAHPKIDPETGVMYAFGVAQGPGMALMVYRMERDGKLTLVHRVIQRAYHMIHDMMLTKQHIVFVIPPVTYDLPSMLSGKATVADAVRYAQSEPLRFLILRKDGTGAPVTIDQPANMVFHHGNAFEKDGQLIIDTIISGDDSVLKMLNSFQKDQLPPSTRPKITRIAIDLAKSEVVSRTELDDEQEFPRFDSRRSGEDARFLYAMEGLIEDDPLAMTALVRHDLHKGRADRAESGKARALGETVFVPLPGKTGEDEGWLLTQGYDAGRDRNFLEIRDAGSLDLAARVWTPSHFPLGFHGNFQVGAHVSAEPAVAG